MRINEAIDAAKAAGRNVTKKSIAQKIWPGSSEITQMVNMSNLCSGRRATVDDRIVRIICDETGVDANFLFD